jgi:hypothetical protein
MHFILIGNQDFGQSASTSHLKSSVMKKDNKIMLLIKHNKRLRTNYVVKTKFEKDKKTTYHNH